MCIAVVLQHYKVEKCLMTTQTLRQDGDSVALTWSYLFSCDSFRQLSRFIVVFFFVMLLAYLCMLVMKIPVFIAFQRTCRYPAFPAASRALRNDLTALTVSLHSLISRNALGSYPVNVDVRPALIRV